jgi:predicted nucleotidyltransferase
MNKPFSIEEIKGRVSAVAEQYGIEKAFLFGSYARGEATPESDVDICIEKGKIRTLFELSGFCVDLEETLGSHVDVVTTAALDGSFKENIEKDMVQIYG